MYYMTWLSVHYQHPRFGLFFSLIYTLNTTCYSHIGNLNNQFSLIKIIKFAFLIQSLRPSIQLDSTCHYCHLQFITTNCTSLHIWRTLFAKPPRNIFYSTTIYTVNWHRTKNVDLGFQHCIGDRGLISIRWLQPYKCLYYMER